MLPSWTVSRANHRRSLNLCLLQPVARVLTVNRLEPRSRAHCQERKFKSGFVERLANILFRFSEKYRSIFSPVFFVRISRSGILTYSLLSSLIIFVFQSYSHCQVFRKRKGYFDRGIIIQELFHILRKSEVIIESWIENILLSSLDLFLRKIDIFTTLLTSFIYI